MVKTLLLSFFYLVLILVLISLWGFYQAIRPFRIISSQTPKDFGLIYENVSFHTKDNVLIKGWFIPSQKPNAKTIILLHGYPADKGDILPSRIFLHKTYNLLFLDFRYLGESEGSYSTVGKNEVFDLLAAVDYLRSRGINEVGVWGFSVGGAVALMAAAETTAIKAMVIESAYARLDWMVNEYYRIPILRYPLSKLTVLWAKLFLKYDVDSVSPAVAAEKLRIPMLLIYSKKDNVISIAHGEFLQKALQHNTKAEFIFVDELAHGESLENYQDIVEKFFEKNL